SLGEWRDLEKHQFIKEEFAVSKVKKNKSLIGTLGPFYIPAARHEIKELVKKYDLRALNLEQEVLGSKGKLFKLSSDVKMPRCLLSYIGNGYREITDIESNWERSTVRIFNDDGYSPFILKYKKSEIEALPDFDIVMTAERIGTLGAYTHIRLPLVTQKFRKAMTDLKVRGLQYVPVELVD
ncbi:hypothetical protein LNTAR_18425, partial [Lentisphaera araneosa HTCC2155]